MCTFLWKKVSTASAFSFLWKNSLYSPPPSKQSSLKWSEQSSGLVEGSHWLCRSVLA